MLKITESSRFNVSVTCDRCHKSETRFDVDRSKLFTQFTDWMSFKPISCMLSIRDTFTDSPDEMNLCPECTQAFTEFWFGTPKVETPNIRLGMPNTTPLNG